MVLIRHRFLSENPQQAEIALQLYEFVLPLPLVCTYSLISPRVFLDPHNVYKSPVDLLIKPDQNILRMLYSQGITLDRLGIRSRDDAPIETDPRVAWQLFAAHYYLFRGTPTSVWLEYVFDQLFGVTERLNARTAQDIYTQIDISLKSDEFQPRALYQSFNIEALCTTDYATDTLEDHQTIKQSDWHGRILPTFCPDDVIDLDDPNWWINVQRLSEMTGITIHNYGSYLRAVEMRRAYFKLMGAVATDQSVHTPLTLPLNNREADEILTRAFKRESDPSDAGRFTAHMLIEMARMSSEDGLVMQLHTGVLPNHNVLLTHRFGRDLNVGIPVRTEFTRNLQPLLNAYGNHANFSLIVFALDETTYARELAPLAGHYPSVKLGAPWGINNSINGMTRFFDQVMDSAGLYNTVGYNADTHALSSVAAQHDVWRRMSCNWLAGLVVRCQIDMDDAYAMARACAYELAKTVYNV